MRVPAVLLAFLSTSLVLAGCLGDGDDEGDGAVPSEDYGPGFTPAAFDAAGLPVPALLCQAPLANSTATGESGMTPMKAEAVVMALPSLTRCNFEMTPDEGRQGNEVTIAVNPKDPRNVVGGAKDYFPADAGECVWDGVYVTHDGAATAYEDRSFDGSPWRLMDGDPSDFAPNYASQFWCTTDPVAYFDVNGRLYYVLMAYQADPVTGSKTGEEELPNGALNDWAFNRATQIVAISDDGGDTFHTFTAVLEGTFPVDFHDKAWLAASADGTIHIMWLASLAPGNMYCRSTDEGQTYLCDEILATTVGVPGVTADAGQGSFLEVGTGAEVYAIWTTSGVQFRRSLDTGENWEPAREIQGLNDATMPGLSGRDRRGGFPALATDRNADSPFADSLYIAWQDGCGDVNWTAGCSSGGGAVWAIASHDKGDTWSAPVRVSGPVGEGEWNIFSTVSVSPGGVVDVSWMGTDGTTPVDSEGLGEHDKLTQWYAYSLDGGATFSEPYQVRDAGDGGWDPALCRHQNGMIFIGDYNDIDSSWQAAHPVWPDSRNGVCDVYTATVQRPMFAEGWTPEAKQAAEAFIVEHPLT